MAFEAIVRVVDRAQPVGIGHGLREVRVNFGSPLREWRTYWISITDPKWEHGAAVTDGLQLTRALDALEEQRQLVLVDPKFRMIGVWADERWMGNWYSPRL